MYKKRIADQMLSRRLAGKGAVLIEGPKWCGKTTTARQQSKSILDLGDIDVLRESLNMVGISSKKLLEGDVPRLIDEWQTIPALWDAVRCAVDIRGLPSQFILTGSSVLPDADATVHTGTGRICRMRMRPMSLYESGESNGTVSIQDLFDGKVPDVQSSSLDIDDIAFLTCRGGWPAATLLSGDIALDQAFDYVEAVAESDIQRVDGVKRDPRRVQRLMRSFARNIAQQVSYSTYRADMLSNDSESLDENTVADYIRALKRLFVVDDLEAWTPNLRSRAAIRTSDTRYYADPSIAAASLGAGPGDLIKDLETFGRLFESMAVRDLRVYAEALDGRLYHYRDSSGLECDTVIHRRNGTYALVEVKLGGDAKIEQGAESLRSLAGKIDTSRMPAPSFLMVLTAVGRYAYRRKDGIFVVPIGCLKP